MINQTLHISKQTKFEIAMENYFLWINLIFFGKVKFTKKQKQNSKQKLNINCKACSRCNENKTGKNINYP